MEYLGYQLDAAGIHPTEKGMEAIKSAPKPKDLTTLRAFLNVELLW